AISGTIKWYADSTGGGSLFTGTTFTTPSISTTTIYYAEAVDGACVNDLRTAVVATVNDNPINTVSIAGNVLTADEIGASYQWIDCDNGNVSISGETNQSFTATGNGNYAVEVTQNGCTATSLCTMV